MTDQEPAINLGTVKVWDVAVRVFHWSLVGCFAAAWASADAWDAFHEVMGYAAVTLVAFRLLWGLVGGRYARFGQFVRRPTAVFAYLGQMLRGREGRYIGHNPAGGAMVVALLVMMTVTGVTGWMGTLDAFWGYEWVEELHEGVANGLLLMVAIHVAGVLFASFRHGENLVRAMISGSKRAPAEGDVT